MKTLQHFPQTESIEHFVSKNPESFFLNSADSFHESNRYSYVGYKPAKIVDDKIQIKNLISEFSQNPKVNYFTGGLVGYFGYSKGPVPQNWWGFYDSVLVLDHHQKQAFVASEILDENSLKQKTIFWDEVLQTNSVIHKTSEQSHFIQQPNFENFENKINIIKKYLKQGDCYQINLTERFMVKTNQSSAEIFSNLRKISPSPYAAFINGGDFQILSASPECFLKARGRIIETHPIKGTRARSLNKEKDEFLKNELLDSQKDKAELLMIIDLERNDLGKVCEFGSIDVENLFQVQTFAQVHHLVSKISGQLKKDKTVLDAIISLFPGGSITGAPKKRAMEIISELEDKPRSVYTGALGFIGINGNTLLNLPIRTLTQVGKTAYFHAGCGIVIDSDSKIEFEEMMTKASGMMKALNL